MTQPANRPQRVRLLVTGGRDYRDRKAAWEVLDKLLRERGIEVLIHGACPLGTGGADRLAHDWAFARGVPVLPFPPREELDGKWPGAGPHRNERMLRAGRPTAGLAFPGGLGTDDMVARLKRARIPVWIPFGGVMDPQDRERAQRQQQQRGPAQQERTGRRG